MTIPAFSLSPELHPAPLSVIGVSITVLATSASRESGEITLQEGPAGSGPPPHSHAWDESFYVLKGTVDFEFNGKSGCATPGTLVHLPAGAVHGFRFGTDGGAMIEITGKNSQATAMFSAIAANMRPGPPDIPAVIRILEQHGVTVAA